MIFSAINDLAVSTIGGAGPVQPSMASFLPDWLNPDVFLRDSPLGPWVILLVCAIVFAETGLLVGFFLPGDSMLFTAGLLVSTGAIEFNLFAMCGLIIVAAIIGNQTGYLIGSKAYQPSSTSLIHGFSRGKTSKAPTRSLKSTVARP